MSLHSKIPMEALLPVAGELICHIKEYTKGKAVVCGSIRRNADYAGDIDLVVGCSPQEAYNAIRKGSACRGVPAEPLWMSGGDKQCSLMVCSPPEHGPISVDITMAEKSFWGAAVLHATGSKEFNVWMRAVAKRQKYVLNQYGLFYLKERIAGVDEEQVFEALGISFISPKKRSPKFRKEWPRMVCA